MNFHDMHVLAKRVDTQVQALEQKLANPMGMIYSNNSGRGVKILSMLKGMIEDVEKKKAVIEQNLNDENLKWSDMVDDYNTVDKFKSEIIANLDECENEWSARYPDYKPFVSSDHEDSIKHEEISSLNDLSIGDTRLVNNQITDQSLNDSLNITMF